MCDHFLDNTKAVGQVRRLAQPGLSEGREDGDGVCDVVVFVVVAVLDVRRSGCLGRGLWHVQAAAESAPEMAGRNISENEECVGCSKHFAEDQQGKTVQSHCPAVL